MRFKIHPRLLFAAAALVSLVLLSPKWTFAPAAWIAPAFVMMAIHGLRAGKAFLVAAGILFISGMAANWGVMPFPSIVLVLLSLQLAITGSLSYLFSVLIVRRTTHWMRVFVFPCFAVVHDFMLSFGGGGTLGSIVYTQAENLPLLQLASITGIWGISLFIYTSSSLVYIWFCESRAPLRLIKAFAIVLGVILLWGSLRIETASDASASTVRVASISAWNIEPLKTVYHDAFDKKITLNPSELTQTSPELAELNKALAVFVEDPLNPKFERTHKALVQFQDSLLSLAAREANAGAKLVAFSEALLLTVKPRENDLIEKAQQVAKENDVWLVLSLGTFLPGKVEAGRKFVENKAVLISPTGGIENIFFKNKPVPFVEGSVPGDGEVPVVSTAFGHIATSICYDGDFPALMRKAGKKAAQLMILPSGDWREISPMHSHIARVRAIENGFALLRPASGGVSIACDQVGRILAKRDFYDSGEKILVANIPVRQTRTLYTQIGDVVPWTCVVFLALLIAGLLWRRRFVTAAFRQGGVARPARRRPTLQD